MTKTEYLLSCLIEECSEVQKASTKALRFGLDDKYKDYDTPLEQLCAECVDVLAIIKMLQNEGVLPELNIDDGIQKKIDRVNKYIDYSKNRNILV